MINETGGPAFPGPDDYSQDGNPIYTMKMNMGMTLRDYFAAKATEDDIEQWQMTGRQVEKVQNYANGQKGVVTVPERLTREQAKYRYSDAMLEARK
jgi:hypothetical protein